MASKQGSKKTINRRQRRKNAKLRAIGKEVSDNSKGIHNLKNNYPARASRDVSSAMVRKKLSRESIVNVLDYAATLGHPWSITNALIPDWTTFPRGVSQIRTVGSIFLGEADSGFMITLFPGLFESGNFILPGGSTDGSSYIRIDGVDYGPGSASTIFSVHNYDDWSNILDQFRVISMGARLKYTGKVLNASGSICSACSPPAVDVPVTYDELADYNYAYIGQAAKGVAQIWMPAGIQSFETYPPDATFGTDELPCIQLAAVGLPNSETVFEFEWVINIETFSNNQALTANAYSGKPDPMKMSAATSAVSKAHMEKKTSGPANAIKDIGKAVLGNAGESLLDLAQNALSSYSGEGLSVGGLTSASELAAEAAAFFL